MFCTFKGLGYLTYVGIIFYKGMNFFERYTSYSPSAEISKPNTNMAPVLVSVKKRRY